MFIFTRQLLFMYKYKYFLILSGAIAVLLLWVLFPLSFDNNDDQTMFIISSGVLSGQASPNIVLSNICIGYLLEKLFLFSDSLNWYTLYLELVLLFCFLLVCWILIKNNKITLFISCCIVLILFLGFFALCIVKIQYTTVALLCSGAALLLLQSDYRSRSASFFLVLILTISFLIRKEVFYIFIFFAVPAFLKKVKHKDVSGFYGLFVILSGVFFLLMLKINHSDNAYYKYQTYSNIKGLDIIAAKNIKMDDRLLKKHNVSIDDILLLQSWFVADEYYLKDHRLEQLAKELKTNRNLIEVKAELLRYVSDERYVLFFYLFTFIMVFIFVRQQQMTITVNLMLFLFLLLYLTVTSRIPHRVTFPILSYLIFLNLSLFAKSETDERLKTALFGVLVLVSIYKFYCTFQLKDMQQKNHQLFAYYQQEINSNPETIFIALDDLQMPYMNAWQKPSELFNAQNVLFCGWYTCAPDYQKLLKIHNLKNLTSDLSNNQKVLFLTESKLFMQAYVNVMKQRYNLHCHFEEQQDGFRYLHPKKLVFDN
jgi:hypothetical protein